MFFFFQISVRDLFRCFDFGPRYAENPMRCTRLLGSPTRNWPFAPQKKVTRWGDYLVSADCISFGKGRLTWQAIFAAFFFFPFSSGLKNTFPFFRDRFPSWSLLSMSLERRKHFVCPYDTAPYLGRSSWRCREEEKNCHVQISQFFPFFIARRNMKYWAE